MPSVGETRWAKLSWAKLDGRNSVGEPEVGEREWANVNLGEHEWANMNLGERNLFQNSLLNSVDISVKISSTFDTYFFDTYRYLILVFLAKKNRPFGQQIDRPIRRNEIPFDSCS